MRERITMGFALLILAVMIPYLGTMVLTGVVGEKAATVEELDTGKRVALEVDGQYQTIDVEAYLRGTLPDILQGTEDIEVWKSLAVIERTNIYKKMEGISCIDQADLDLTYLTEEQQRELWGERQYEAYAKKAERAVLETAGETLVCEGSYIDALYHRASIGSTVSAEELFGEPVSYLTAVPSTHDVESKDYMNIIILDKSQVQELKIEESTEHGYVKRVLCDGEELTGEEAQDRFQLPSLNYYIEDMGDTYRIVCLGTGHGLGVSLYGAEYMAKNGSDYKDILTYYYPGVSIQEHTE